MLVSRTHEHILYGTLRCGSGRADKAGSTPAARACKMTRESCPYSWRMVVPVCKQSMPHCTTMICVFLLFLSSSNVISK